MRSRWSCPVTPALQSTFGLFDVLSGLSFLDLVFMVLVVVVPDVLILMWHQNKLLSTFTMPLTALSGTTTTTGLSVIHALIDGLESSATRIPRSFTCTPSSSTYQTQRAWPIQCRGRTRIEDTTTNRLINDWFHRHTNTIITYVSSNRNLDYNQLSGTIPSSIGSLVNLQYLYVNPIESNRIESNQSNHRIDTTINE